jgi:hypothetical protein
MTWLALWTVVFFGALVAFVYVSALVGVRGWAEVRALFQELEAAEASRERGAETTPERGTDR